MLVEIFFPPEGTFCVFEPAFNVPYRLVQVVEAPVQTLQEALDWTWRYANLVHAGDPWARTRLRSAMVGDVFFANGEAHAVMMVGFERFESQREGETLILHGKLGFPLIRPSPFHAHALERPDGRSGSTASSSARLEHDDFHTPLARISGGRVHRSRQQTPRLVS